MESIKISRFLIVDTDQDAATQFKVLLGRLQYQNITIAQDGEQALELMETKRIQFILASWDIEPMSGTAFVQRVLATDKFRYTPFLIYSNRLSDQDIEMFQHFGLENILKNTSDEDVTIKTIKDIISAEEDLDPIEHRIRQADHLRMEKQYTQALSIIKPALVQGPFFFDARTLLGQIYYEQEMYEDAEKAVQDVLSQGDEHQPALQMMARIYARTKRHNKAVEILQKMSMDHPYNVEALLNLGIVNSELEHYDRAMDNFTKVRQIDPTNKRVNEEEGKMRFRQGKFELASQLLQEMENTEQIARDFNNIAVGLVGKSDFKRAIPTYGAAISIMKNHEDIIHLMEYNLGLALRKSGDLEKAFVTLTECFKKHPNFVKAYAALVRLVKEMEEKDIIYDRKLMHELKTIHRSKHSA